MNIKRTIKILLLASMLMFVFSIPILAEDVNVEVEQDYQAVVTEDTQQSSDITEDVQQGDVLLEDNTENIVPVDFADVDKNAWYYDSVKFVSEKKICEGTGNNMFSPESALTRAMLVTIIYRYAGSPAVEGGVNFSDINVNDYYYNALIWATKNNIITGYPNGTFMPDVSIKRQEVATIMCRFAAYSGHPINSWLDIYEFADGGNVMAYSKQSMQWAYSYGIVAGKSASHLDPLGNATRAECAKIIKYYDSVDLTIVPTSAPSLFNGNHIVTYDAMCEYLTTMEKMYPSLVRVSSAGLSAEGRDMKLVTMGTGGRYIYMQGNLHGREYLSLNYLLEIIDSYAYAFATNTSFDGYNVQSLLSQFTIVIIPCANPDGQNIAINGYSAAANPAAVSKMYNPEGSSVYWKANAQGVDLNRNFPVAWAGGSIKRPANANYGGPFAGSAIETQNIMRVLGSYRFETVLDCHTAGNVIYYADNNCSAAYIARAGALSKALSASSGYTSLKTNIGPGAANYVRHKLGVPGLTVELYPDVSYPLNASRFTSAVWSKAKNIPLVTMDFLLKN